MIFKIGLELSHWMTHEKEISFMKGGCVRYLSSRSWGPTE